MSLGMALLMMAAPAKSPGGAALLQKSCTVCHTLDSITARRLSREDWDLELDKMIAMGAKVENRKTLLDYLARTYGLKR